MQITMFALARTSATRAMRNLDAILDKALASAEARKIDPAVLLGSRLAPDMFPLIRQVQIAYDFGKGPMARLAGIDNPKHEAFIDSIPEAALAGSEDRDITIQAGSQTLEFKGFAYLVGFAIPNLNFHMSMAYAILRHNGVDIGKRDYIGPA